MTSLMVFLALLGQPSTEDWEVLVVKLEETDPGDPKALLELGQLCEEKKCPGLALNAYRKIGRAGEETDVQLWCEAYYRIARIQISRGQHEKAFGHLRGVLLKCPDHESARSLLRNAESSKTREQVRHVQKGDEYLEQGSYSRALEAYEQAFRLTPETPTRAAYVPRRVILGKLAGCRSSIDDARYEREFLRVNRSLEACPTCSRGSTAGFLDCPRCGGTGEALPLDGIPFRRGLKRERSPEPCRQCGGRGYLACGTCLALGYSSTEITVRERKALLAVAQGVSDPKLYGQSLERALEIVENALLSVKEGATLNYLRAMKPEYALSGKLRKALGSVPPTPKSVELALKEWEKTRDNDRARVNFLLNYACEFAAYIRQFDMLRAGQRIDVSCLEGETSLARDVLTPEILCAFPDSADTDCVAVRGTLVDYRPDADGEHKGHLVIEGEIPHGVHFFTWLPSAKSHLEWLQNRSWKKPLEGLSGDYPFGLGREIEKAPRDHQVIVVGRFLRDLMGYPRNWFEVWDIRIGPSRLQEGMLRDLSEPMDVTFPGNSLGQISRILGQWFDLELEFDGVSDALVTRCDARACPKGLLLDAIAKSTLQCDWYYKDGRVVFCRRGTNPLGEDMAAVLGRIERPPDMRLVVGVVSESPARSVVLPDDPAGLRVAASEFQLRMEFDSAGRCYEALLAMAETPGKKTLLARLRDKMRLFQELTGLTPVSRLVEAEELADVIYQKPSGDLVQATVVLRREGDAFVIQEAYGASFRILPELVKKVTPLPAADWLEGKLAELASREAEAAAADPQEKAAKLFLLALFSKTHSFTDRGMMYLNQAVELDEFEPLLGRFFPERRDELAAAWRQTTGREPFEQEAPPPPRPEVPEIVPEITPDPPPGEVAEPPEEELTDKELLTLARTRANQGSANARHVLKGEGAAEWRQRALASFTAAERALALLLERRPADPAGLRLRDDITAMKSACTEDLRFFEEPSGGSSGAERP